MTLTVSRKEGEWGLTNIDDCIDTSVQGLEDYIKKKQKNKKNKERLITAASNNIGKISTDWKTIKTRKQKWEKK